MDALQFRIQFLCLRKRTRKAFQHHSLHALRCFDVTNHQRDRYLVGNQFPQGNILLSFYSKLSLLFKGLVEQVPAGNMPRGEKRSKLLCLCSFPGSRSPDEYNIHIFPPIQVHRDAASCELLWEPLWKRGRDAMPQLKERSASTHTLLAVFKPKARASQIDHDREHRHYKAITVFALEQFDCTLKSTVPCLSFSSRKRGHRVDGRHSRWSPTAWKSHLPAFSRTIRRPVLCR